MNAAKIEDKMEPAKTENKIEHRPPTDEELEEFHAHTTAPLERICLECGALRPERTIKE